MWQRIRTPNLHLSQPHLKNAALKVRAVSVLPAKLTGKTNTRKSDFPRNSFMLFECVFLNCTNICKLYCPP